MGIQIMQASEIQEEILHAKFVGEYKEAFSSLVDLFEEHRIEDIEERMQLVDLLCDVYIQQTSERPDPYELNRLAEIILYEHMEGDSHPDKVANTDFPILTDSQTKRRHNSEVGDTPFDTMGQDRKSYLVPIRRKVSVQDQIKMEMDRIHKQKGSKESGA